MKTKLALTLITVTLAIVACHTVGPEDPVVAFEAEVLPPDETTVPVADYLAAVGVGAVVTVFVEVFKRLKAIPDGKAGLVATVANVVIFAALTAAGAFGFDVTGADAQSVIKILEQIGNLALMIVSSPLVYDLLRKAQVLNKIPGRF